MDKNTGERCWHAYECMNPNCPGARTSGRPHYVFILTELDSQEAIHCPACAKLRDPATELPQQWAQWGSFVRPYELPETFRRRAEPDAERRQAIESMRRGAMAPAP